MCHVNTLAILYVFALSTPTASRDVHQHFEAAVIPQGEVSGSTRANVGPVLAIRGFQEARPFGRCVLVAAPYQLRRLILEGDLVLDPAYLVADVIVATDVGVRPGPVTEIGHKPLILKLGIVSGLGIGPDGFVLADDVEGEYEKLDVGERFAIGKGGKGALQGVSGGDAVLHPHITVSGDDIQFTVIDDGADALIVLVLFIEIGQGDWVRGEVSDIVMDISVLLWESDVALFF